MREEGSRTKSYTDDRVFPGVSRISAYSADIGGGGGGGALVMSTRHKQERTHNTKSKNNKI